MVLEVHTRLSKNLYKTIMNFVNSQLDVGSYNCDLL